MVGGTLYPGTRVVTYRLGPRTNDDRTTRMRTATDRLEKFHGGPSDTALSSHPIRPLDYVQITALGSKLDEDLHIQDPTHHSLTMDLPQLHASRTDTRGFYVSERKLP